MIRLALVFLAVAVPAAAQVAPPPFNAGKLLPIASGQWTYAVSQAGSEARYGSHLLLSCNRASRTVTVSRPGTPVGTLTVVTDMLTRALPPGGRLSANDPLLDALAFSRGRFLVVGGTGQAVAVPSWPEAARAIEDCRN